jgi:hypothetical protein
MIRNIALAVAAGSLLGAGLAAAQETKPSDTPRTEQQRRGWQGNAGAEGCMGGQHAGMGAMQGRMAERHARMGGQHGGMGMQQGRMGMQHGQAGECPMGGAGCPMLQGQDEHQHGS